MSPLEEELCTARKMYRVYLIVFVISSAIVIISGACAIASFNSFQYFVITKVFVMPIIFLITGIVAGLVAFVGWRGVVEYDNAQIIAFGIALGVILGVDLAIGITGAIVHNKYPPQLRQAMNYTISTLTLKDEKGWDILHTSFECCGLLGPRDWVDASKGSGQNIDRLPNTCCKEISGDNQCRDGIKEGVNSPWEQGCWDFVKGKMDAITGILMGVGFTMVLSLIAGICVTGRLSTVMKKIIIANT